jgi:mono/diheme cytochrome c family protein
VVQAMLRGTHLNVKDQVLVMPDFGDKYSDQEVAAVANYVLLQFGGKQGTVTAEQVAGQRKN